MDYPYFFNGSHLEANVVIIARTLRVGANGAFFFLNKSITFLIVLSIVSKAILSASRSTISRLCISWIMQNDVNESITLLLNTSFPI